MGVTPSSSTYRAFELTTVGSSVYGAGTNDSHVGMTSGAYYNSGWKYSRTGINACRFSMNDIALGQMEWFTSASGTAGDPISFTQAMTLDASGNLIVGGTTANGKLTVVGITNQREASGTACFNNQGIKIISGATSGTLTTVATLTKPVTNSTMRRIVFSVTSTNEGSDNGYAVATSVREVLISNYGGSTSILQSTELSNNMGSINAGVISVVLTTSAALSGTTTLLQATATITGVSSSGLTARFMTKVEIISADNYQDITF